MKYFFSDIFKNPQVEFIHVSQDEDLESALEWAKTAKFPWLTVTSKDAALAKLDIYGTETPSYALISKHCRVLATTEEAAKAKLKELTQK